MNHRSRSQGAQRAFLATVVGALISLAVSPPVTEAVSRSSETPSAVASESRLHGGSVSVAPSRRTWTEAVRDARANPGRHGRTAARRPLRTAPIDHPQRHARDGNVLILPEPTTPTGGMQGGLVATTPTLVTTFDGITQADAGPLEPPDPWVAASPSYVVASTNGLVRISSRAGTTLASIPSWALFGVPPSQFDSDPRILWDGYHGRWVGSVVTFNYPFFNQNYLNIIVSESADPFGAWNLISFDSANVIPDYPGIATSTDKIVVGTNDFDEVGHYLGGEIDEISWGQILLGGPVTVYFSGPDPDIFTPRPAQVISTASDVHLIAEKSNNGQLLYRKLSGAATTVQIGAARYANLNGDVDLDNGPFAAPPQPRQPGNPPTIADAVDHRPTDAVWRNNTIWLVSTFPHDFGPGDVDTVRIIRIATASGADVTFDGLVGAAGTDTFMGGVGLLADGTLVLSYETSSPTQPIRSAAVTFNDIDGLSSPLTLADSDGTYDGTRWGDYQAVAADPLGGEAAWVIGETAAADGTWRTHVARLTYDATSPTAPGAPTQTVVTPSTLSPALATRISWAAATDAGSGIAGYVVETAVDGGAFGSPATITGTSIVRPLLFGHSYRFRVNAIDTTGNVGPFATGPAFTPTLYQQTSGTVYSTGWTTASSSAYSGGTAKSASIAGRYVTFSFTGRAVAFLSYKSTTRGSVKIYVDGVYKKTVSLYSTTVRTRQLVFSYAWSAYGSHKLKLVVVGTSGHPRVDVDGFAVLK